MSTHSSQPHAAKNIVPVIPAIKHSVPVIKSAIPVAPEVVPQASAALDEHTPKSVAALQQRSLAKHRIATEHTPAGAVANETVDEGKK